MPSVFVFLVYLFIYLFWLHWVFVAARGLSLVVVSGGYSLKPNSQCNGIRRRLACEGRTLISEINVLIKETSVTFLIPSIM